MAGSYLAVPLYKNDGSQIVFYKIGYPKGQKPYSTRSFNKQTGYHYRSTIYECICSCIHTLSDGYYLLAVWTDDHHKKIRGLDFYCSKEKNLKNGFDTNSMIHIPTSLFYNYEGRNNFQNINFVNDFDGKLYLIAMANSAASLPLRPGIDIADLFEIRVSTATETMIEDAKKYDPQGITAQLKPGTKRPYVLFMTEKHMFCKQGMCNFSSEGATIYIPDQQNIFIYSLPYWLAGHGKHLTFAQYGSIQKTYPVA